MLSDDEKRGLYDRFGHAGVDQRYSKEDIFRGADFGDIFGDLGGIFEQFFGRGFGGFGGRTRSPLEGRDLGLRLGITLEEAFRGTSREVEVERQTACKPCDGRGVAPGGSLRTCPECDGRGQVQRAQRTVFGSFVQVTGCPACEGTGHRVEKPCPACRGRGHTPHRASIEIQIPPGVDDGDRLRLEHQGDVLVRGGRAGHLYVEVEVRPDPRFARNGADLLTAVAADYPTLVLGGQAGVSVFGEEIEVDVPAGSRPGQRLRVRGKGMPDRRGGRGDLFLQLELYVPEKPTRRVKETLEQLRQALQEDGGWFPFRKSKSK